MLSRRIVEIVRMCIVARGFVCSDNVEHCRTFAFRFPIVSLAPNSALTAVRTRGTTFVRTALTAGNAQISFASAPTLRSHPTRRIRHHYLRLKESLTAAFFSRCEAFSPYHKQSL